MVFGVAVSIQFAGTLPEPDAAAVRFILGVFVGKRVR